MNTAALAAPWPVVVKSGKGTQYYPITTNPVSLSILRQSIYPIDKAYEIKTSVIDKSQKVKETYIGKLNGIRVYDFIYPFDKKKTYYSYLKVIVLEKQPNLFMPVLYCFISDPSPEAIKNSFSSFIVADKNLVASEIPIAGTGNEIDLFYLYVPPNILKEKNIVPRIVDTNIISDTLEKKLPSGYYVGQGGKVFNINTLHFHAYITRDAHCFYGSIYSNVDMQFKLDQEKLKLVSFKISAPKN